MSGERRNVAGLFEGTTDPDPDPDVLPDRTAGIPAPPAQQRAIPAVPPAGTVERQSSGAADSSAPATKAAKKNPYEPDRLTIPLAAGIYEQLANATETAQVWQQELLEATLDRHESEMRAKDGVSRHRRRRGAARLQPAQIRVSQHASKRLRQIAARHGVPLTDVMRTLIGHAIADRNND